MNALLPLIRPALSLFAALSIVTGLLYPLAVTGLAKAMYPEQAAGSLIVKEGKTVGSRLIGQNFSDAKYFWGRPSSTGPMPYNATASSGSNQGPLNPALVDAAKGRIEALKAADPKNTRPIPADLAMSSGSGLDPQISPEAADYQAERVARSRGLDVKIVRQLIVRHTEERALGLFGEVRVNVLALNLALDALNR